MKGMVLIEGQGNRELTLGGGEEGEEGRALTEYSLGREAPSIDDHSRVSVQGVAEGWMDVAGLRGFWMFLEAGLVQGQLAWLVNARGAKANSLQGPQG